MHRLVMLSATYRQDSQHPEIDAMAKRDPAVRSLWRAKVRRLAGDQLRDAMLAVSGELTDKDSGRGIEGDPGCRSVFVKHLRNVPDEMLKSFDGPDMFSSCSKRYVSTTALQSLLLMNSDFAVECSQHFAQRLLDEAGPQTDDQIALAWKLAFSTKPTAVDITAGAKFVELQQTTIRQQSPKADDATIRRRAMATFCQALLSSNRFLYVD